MTKIFLKMDLCLPLFAPLLGPVTIFSQTCRPFPRGWLLPNLVEIGLVVHEKKSFKWEVTVDGRQTKVMIIAHLALWARWAKKRAAW